MRVVVTRPKHAGQRTAQHLVTLGHDAVLLPVTAPVHDPAAAEQALAEPHSALAVTSAEAIRVLAALGSRLQPHLDTRIFTVGRATATAAEACGFANVRSADAGGTELADLIAADIPRAAPLLYLAGLPRAPAFEQRLAANGVRFRVTTCYSMQRLLPDANELRSALLDASADVVLFYSLETALAFFALASVRQDPQAFAGTRFLCLSAAIVAAIPDDFRHQAEVARTPDEAALFAIL